VQHFGVHRPIVWNLGQELIDKMGKVRIAGWNPTKQSGGWLVAVPLGLGVPISGWHHAFPGK
jgi:hypothetical protein